MEAIMRIIFLAGVGGVVAYGLNKMGVPWYFYIPICVGIGWFGSDLLRKLKS